MAFFRQLVAWLALAIVGLTAAALALQLYFAAAGKEGAAWTQSGIVLVGICAALAHFATTDLGPKGPRGRRWATAKPIAGILISALTGFSAASLILDQWKPQTATESERGIIEKGVSVLLGREEAEKARQAEAARRTKAVNGFWGEPGCAVVYQVQTTGDRFTLEAVRRPPDREPYTMVGRILSTEGMTVEVVGVSPERAKGISLTLSVQEAAGKRTLILRDNSRPNAELFTECEPR